MTFVTSRMEIDYIILSKISQALKACYMMSLIRGTYKKVDFT
jgi:hypothetical protein